MPETDPVLSAEANGAHTAADDAHGHDHAADGHGAESHSAESHAPFNVKETIGHHNLPYPAWEPMHGKPLLIFDLGTYAAMHLDHLREDPAFATADAATYRTWAEEAVARGSDRGFPYPAGLDAGEVARAMTVASQHTTAFPKALSGFNHQTFFGVIALVLLFLVVGVIFRRRADQIRPAGRVQHALEAIVCTLRDDVVKPNFHERASTWTPFFVSMFLMILAVNLFGLIPGGGAMSGNIGVTAGFAVVVFFCMLFFGMKEQGPKFWITLVPIHFTWAMSPIWLLLLVIELMGLVIKPFALAVRLFANMFAGHTVLLILLSLGYVIADRGSHSLAYALGGTGYVLAVALHGMELLVAFVQAYVFTMLSAMFIGMSIHPEH